MSTTSKQDRDFTEQIIGTGLLENSIEWIRINIRPEDLYSNEQLQDWAESNGYIKEQ